MYKADDKRFKTLNDTWDIPKMKLTAYIVEARDLYVGPKSQISCSVRLERRVFGKTNAQASASPQWNQLCWTGFDDANLKTLVFEVFDKKTNIGEVRIALPRAPRDSLVDAWIPLKPSAEGKKKGSAPTVSGQLHLRYIFSVIPETRPAIAKMIKQEYFYRKNALQFRSGDLICYSGTGLLHTAHKLVHNSEHSQAGLVVEIPNKWTGENELYVLELTYNLDGTIDCFDEAPRRGLVLFNLKERLHSFHGGLITHYPLRHALEEIPRKDLSHTVLRVHARAEVPSVNNTLTTQFVLKTFPFDPKRNLREFISLTGSRFIAQALVHVALLREEDFPSPGEMTLEWLKQQPIWDQPNLVRMPVENLKQVMETVRGNKMASVKQAPAAARPSPPPSTTTSQQQFPVVAPPPQRQQQPPTFPAQASFGASPGSPMMTAAPPASPMMMPPQPQADPQLAAMEAEMRRLEEEQRLQNEQMAAQAAQLEAEARALEQAMLDSQAQMASLQQADLSDEGDDDGSFAANAQLLALSSAGFNPNAFGP